MQEEIEHKTVTLIINGAKLTEQELKKAISRALAHMQARGKSPPHGRMTVKQLAAQNRGMQSIDVNSSEIKTFHRVARKYGIDYAPFKVKGENRYLVFFKAPDTDAMTAAFKEYTAKAAVREKRPSVLARIAQLQSLMKDAVVSRTKHKERER